MDNSNTLKRLYKEEYKMAKITVNENLCKGCEMCVNNCPLHLLELDKTRINAKGYHPAAMTDMSKCTGCKSCATMCPDVCITVER
ncbi:MAG: 4Fe-4S binding protein [Lachnospiraceae bacterium]|nr:4Fe-4S binding protein [Lachnospiraceae bacterium]